jgi:hypothetical protein
MCSHLKELDRSTGRRYGLCRGSAPLRGVACCALYGGVQQFLRPILLYLPTASLTAYRVQCLLLTAYCLLHTAYRIPALLHTAYRSVPLPTTYRHRLIAYWVLVTKNISECGDN